MIHLRISELSRATDVPVATIKYYLREDLLPAGRRTSTTQSQYDDTHVERLRLIRALLGPGKLSIAQTREILRVIDHPDRDLFELLGEAQHVITPARDDVPLEPALDLIARAGWNITPENPAVHQLAEAFAALDTAGFRIPDENLTRYLRASEDVAAAEIDNIPASSPDQAIRYTVLGTILVEPLLNALRRLAQQHEAARRFGS